MDNASERTYQPIFCQILMNEGYTVVHSTRHTPEEYGKDVIAIAPDGVVCAYQLKGNPKSRLTLSQYRNEVAPQLRELLNQRIENPAIPKGNHRSYLVTNGEIEELVQQAIEQENEKNAQDGYPGRKLHTIPRGQLLSWANKLDTSLWPSELEDTKIFLEIITDAGDGIFPIDKFHNLLSELFCLTSSVSEVNKSARNRRMSSAALLTAICLKPFSEKKNHWAIITAWSMFAIYLIAFIEKYGEVNDSDAQFAFIENIIFKSIIELLEEVFARPENLVEGEVLSDFAVYSWRYTLIVAIASILYLSVEKESLGKEFRKRLEDFLPDDHDKIEIWGDAAFPQGLFHLWAIEKRDETQYSKLMDDLLKKCMTLPLPGIYYDAEDVVRNRLSQSLEAFQSPISDDLEDKVSSSWFAKQIILHMAFRDEKDACKVSWGRFSKINSVYFISRTKWEFCLYRCSNGESMTEVFKEQETWKCLKDMSSNSPADLVPEEMLKRPWLLCFWMVLCPQRALPEVVNHAYNAFHKGK